MSIVSLYFSEQLDCGECDDVFLYLQDPLKLAVNEGVTDPDLLRYLVLAKIKSVICQNTSAWYYEFEYDESVLLDPEDPLTECDIKRICCVGCTLQYVKENLPINVADTESIDLEVNSGVLSANVNISGEEDNCLEATPDGLYAPCPPCWITVETEEELITANNLGEGAIFVAGEITLNADIDIQLPIQFSPCGLIHTNGWTLTISNYLKAGTYKIFDTVATELVIDQKSNPTLIPQWFGAIGNGLINDTAALQTALSVAGNGNHGVVYLPPGVYSNTGIIIPNAVSLIGAGVIASVLNYTPLTGNAVSLQTPGANNTKNIISNLKIKANLSSTGAGIFGAVDPLYVSDLQISSFEIEGFLQGIYIPYGLQVRIEFGRVNGPGKLIANSVGVQLGDVTLGTPRLVNTVEIEEAYVSGFETSFVLDGSIADVHGITTEECITAFLIATRCSITGSWIAADTFFFVTRIGGWTIGAYSNYYLGGGIEQDDLAPWCNLATSQEELSAFQKSEFSGAGRLRMRFATSAARGLQFGDVNPAYFYNVGGSIRAEAVTRPFEVNRDAAGAGLSFIRFLQQAVVRGFISVSSLNNMALVGAGGSECVEWDTDRNVAIGGGALAPASTQGHMYIPTVTGTPVAAPSGKTGFAPLVIDTTNNKLYFYSGGAWRDAGP